MEASSPNDGPHDRWGRQKGLTKGKDKTIHTCIWAFKFMRCLYSRFLCWCVCVCGTTSGFMKCQAAVFVLIFATV